MGLVAIGEKNDLRFFSLLLRKAGSWQPNHCHDPVPRNAPRAAAAMTPQAATRRRRAAYRVEFLATTS